MKRVFCLLLVAVMLVASLVACEATTPVEDEEPPPVVAETLPVIEESTTPGVMPPIHFKLSDTYIQLLGDKLSKYNRELVFKSHWSPWTMTVVTGSTIPFIVSASVLNDMDHSLTIEGTDIDVTVGPGEAAGPFEVTFDEPGIFKVDCSLHPGEHGECLIVVEEPPAVAPLPPVFFTLGNVDGAYLQVEGDDLAPFAGPTSGQKGPWTLTLVKGSTLVFHVEAAGRPGTVDHSLTIEGTDIDVTVVGPGGVSDFFEVKFDKLGKFKLDCGLHPGEHGECFIEVVEPLAYPPVFFTLGNVDGSYLQVESDEDLAPFAGPTSGQKGPWTLTMLKGSTLVFHVEAAGRPGTEDHSLTIEGTDLDINVTGPGGVSDFFEVTFDELGKFKLDCSLHPGEHGECFIEVVATLPVAGEEPTPVEEEEPMPVVEGPMPPIYFTIGTDYIRLKGDDLSPYGVTGTEQDPPWTITVAKGTTITITDVTVSGKPGTGDHTFTIQGTDIDESIPEGTIVGPFEVTFNEVGTFTVSCTLHDHGECLIVVAEPAPTMAKYKCLHCPYVYDPELGDPDGGIEPGTPFEEIPDDWVCPVCKVDKSNFEVVEEPPVVEEEPPVEEEEPPVVAGPLPPISFKLADTYIQLIGDDLAPYGLTGTEQDSPWTITIKKGSTITITEVFMGGHPTAEPHIFAIEGTDIEVPLSPTVSEGPFEVTFDEVGTFEVYCKLRSADTYGGKCFIVVEE